MKWKVGGILVLGVVSLWIYRGVDDDKNEYLKTDMGGIYKKNNISQDSVLENGSKDLKVVEEKKCTLEKSEKSNIQQPQQIIGSKKMSFKKSYSQKIYNNSRTVKENQNSILESGNSYQLMEFSRGIGALLAMYEATDSIHYINEALDFCEKVIKKTKKGRNIRNNPKHFKDDYMGWENNNPNYENHKGGGQHLREIPLFEGYLFRYMAKMAYMIEKFGNIPSSVKKRGRDLFNFVKVNGWQKWYQRGEQKSPGCYPYFFRNRTHIVSHWAMVALYLRELTKDMAQKQQYASFLDKYDKQLKENLHLNNNNAYVWNMTWDTPWPYGTDCKTPPKKSVIQDVSHGNHVITYIVNAYEIGTGTWTKKDIQAFSNTVKYVIYDSQKNRFNGDLNGKFIPKVANGIQMADGFVKLACYDRELFDLFDKVRKGQYGKYKFSLYEPQYVAELKLAEKYYIN